MDNNDWEHISETEDIFLYENFVHLFKDKLNWDKISYNEHLSSSFLLKFNNYIHWDIVSINLCLSVEIISELFYFLIWDLLPVNKHFTEKIASAFNYMWTDHDWIFQISQYVKLSENFMRNYKNDLDWNRLSAHQIMSESFIIEFEHLINWDIISNKQTLSTNFISIYKDKINWIALVCNAKSRHNIDYTNIYVTAIEHEITKYLDSNGFAYPLQYSIYRSYMTLIIKKINKFKQKIITIQKQWRHCVSNPSYVVCQRRLYREFTDLIS